VLERVSTNPFQDATGIVKTVGMYNNRREEKRRRERKKRRKKKKKKER
jgi:hypothetical protein